MIDDALRDWQLAELAAADAELRASRAVDAAERQVLEAQAHGLRVAANEALDRLLERYRDVKASPSAPSFPAAPLALSPR